MCACTHVRMCACVHVRMCACTHVRMCACTHVRMCACTHMCMCAVCSALRTCMDAVPCMRTCIRAQCHDACTSMAPRTEGRIFCGIGRLSSKCPATVERRSCETREARSTAWIRRERDASRTSPLRGWAVMSEAKRESHLQSARRREAISRASSESRALRASDSALAATSAVIEVDLRGRVSDRNCNGRHMATPPK